jgi:hypothetical protein
VRVVPPIGAPRRSCSSAATLPTRCRTSNCSTTPTRSAAVGLSGRCRTPCAGRRSRCRRRLAGFGEGDQVVDGGVGDFGDQPCRRHAGYQGPDSGWHSSVWLCTSHPGRAPPGGS